MSSKYPIKRELKNKKYIYRYKSGKIITDQKEIDRINKLRIPPGYHDIKIYSKNSKEQYVAKDDKQRIQVGYHPVWIVERNRKKFRDLVKFVNIYPRLMKKIDSLIKKNDGTKQTLVAVAIKLLDVCKIRPGHEKHLKNTGSYGTTTLCKKHIKKKSNHLAIEFKGKSGIVNYCKIKLNTNLGKHIHKISKNLSGKNSKLFENINYKVTGKNMNDFLQEFDENISVKTFRTYHANIIFIQKILPYLHEDVSENQRKKHTVDAIKEASSYLHHNPATFRNSYLFTPLKDLYIENPDKFKKLFKKDKLNAALIKFIKNNTSKTADILKNW